MKRLFPVILLIACGGLGAETPRQDDPSSAEQPEADTKRPLAEAARIGCADWNTKRFFESAVPESVAACLAAGAEAAAREDGFLGWTALHTAVIYSEDLAVIQALIAAGADPKWRDNHGGTPLHWGAALNGNVAVIQALIAAGADPNARQKDGGTPLHTAAKDNRNEAVVRTLIAANADPNARNNYGWTPLHMVGYARSAEILLAAGAEAGTRDRSGETPLHAAAWFVWEVEVIHTLIAHGAEIDALDRYGNAPLHTAARSAAERIASGGAAIVALLDAGADPTRRNGRGETPWDLAKDNEKFKQSDAYQRLDEARINVPSGP